MGSSPTHPFPFRVTCSDSHFSRLFRVSEKRTAGTCEKANRSHRQCSNGFCHAARFGLLPIWEEI